MKHYLFLLLAVLVPVLAWGQDGLEKDKLYTISPSVEKSRAVAVLPGGGGLSLSETDGHDKLQLWKVEDISGSVRIVAPFENKALKVLPDGKAGVAETNGSDEAQLWTLTGEGNAFRLVPGSLWSVKVMILP